jgi:hypothetical protein
METEGLDWKKLIIMKGLRRTELAMNVMREGEHLWVRGIENVLIYVGKLGEASYRIIVCNVERLSTRFSVKRLGVDAKVGKVEAYKLVMKLGARPYTVVKNHFVDELEWLNEVCGIELSYQDFVNAVKVMGLKVQINP